MPGCVPTPRAPVPRDLCPFGQLTSGILPRMPPPAARPRPASRIACVVALTAAAALAPAGAAAAAPGQGHGSHFRLAWLANDPSNTYDAAIGAGMAEAAARSHSTITTSYAGFDAATQLAQCEEVVSSGDYDALLVTAASPTEIEPCVAAARSAGLPVAAVDLPIGPDNATSAPQVPGVVASVLLPAAAWGDAVTAILPSACAGASPCRVLYVAGFASFPLDQYGLAAVQQAEDGVVLAGTGEAFYDTASARALVAAELADDPGIDVVLASGDQMALGAERAVAAAGLPVRVLGAGAGASALEAVRDGRWFATATALPRTEGATAVELLLRALRRRGAPPVGVDPVEASGLPVWMTGETVGEFDAEWPGP